MTFFVDANILIYALNRNDAGKSAIAAELVREIGRRQLMALNLQVLNETTNVLLKKSALSIGEIRDHVEVLSAFGDDPIDHATVELGWKVRQATGYQWWDCLLLSSARLRSCAYFLTEDLRHGHDVFGVTIIDPFKTSPLDLPFQN